MYFESNPFSKVLKKIPGHTFNREESFPTPGNVLHPLRWYFALGISWRALSQKGSLIKLPFQRG